MNKAQILQLNVVPEGKAAWLSYDQYLTLQRLFEAVPLPAEPDRADTSLTNEAYLKLHRFLTDEAGLTLPLNEAAIHFNAFALLRRGYQVEPITPAEYDQLQHLMTDLEQPDIDDMTLYDTGGHRILYDFLTKMMGLSVVAGRGPAWHRARALLDAYEAEGDDQ